ncbi:MAG: RyR domain-containing protein [Opitutaceae bacterium]|jgi:hypothetical protein
MDKEKIARVCHEANRAWCQACNDTTQLPWDEAPKWQRESAIKGVDFCIANPSAPASSNHDSWFAQKVADGWRYGPVKDAEAKTHPCMVPYDQLPEEQRRKDALFKAIVAALS